MQTILTAYNCQKNVDALQDKLLLNIKMKNYNMIPLTTFYFIRHGETDWNRQNIIMGSVDIPLNELGLKQAHEASHILENESFDIIISSPRIRAQQTAEIIAKKTNKPIVLEESLTERVWGEAEGKPVDPTKSVYNDAHTPRGAETFSASQQRVIRAISSLLLRANRPLLVSHGGVFKALTHHLGYENMGSSNCVPFFFRPPQKPHQPWDVSTLSPDEI